MNRPWLTDDANVWLADNLPSGHCFEWGSGRSTIWLAERMVSVGTVEHDQLWFARLPAMPNVRAYHVPLGSEYEGAIDEYAHDGLDLIVIDGRRRNTTTMAAMRHLKWGTLVIFDDAQRERYKPAMELLHAICKLNHSSKDPDGKMTTVWEKR